LPDGSSAILETPREPALQLTPSGPLSLNESDRRRRKRRRMRRRMRRTTPKNLTALTWLGKNTQKISTPFMMFHIFPHCGYNDHLNCAYWMNRRAFFT
jgi:hypothetical protein